MSGINFYSNGNIKTRILNTKFDAWLLTIELGFANPLIRVTNE